MLNYNSHKSKLPKGDRLKWTPLKDVKPMPLNEDMVRGRRVDPKELSPNKGDDNAPKLLIP